MRERVNEQKARQLGGEFNPVFAAEEQHLRWEQFRHLESQMMLERVRDEVFPDLRKKAAKGSAFAGFMKRCRSDDPETESAWRSGGIGESITLDFWRY